MRRKRKLKTTIQPDAKYASAVVAKFINYLMERGKKSTAERIMYTALVRMGEKTKKDPLEAFDAAIKNATPQLELKSRRVGGANYQVPREVRGERKMFLACKWLINGARTRKGKPMAQKLAEELIDAANNTGYAIKKKADTHRMAEANKAFAHFSW
ncbi:MAG: 30S ribosomal protein S7 [bacterium]|nr:30S ribosomal protein S7 [bacterium]